MSELDLRSLRYLVTLADERHFGRAAERLGIAQPALSQQIQRLERVIGHQLVIRRPQVRLTDAGLALDRAARTTLRTASHAVEAARRAGRGEEGTLVVGFAASVMLTPVASLIPRFRSRCLGVKLELREMSTARQIEELRQGRIDLGFLREPVVRDETLTMIEVYSEPFVVVLPPGHPRVKHRSVRLETLADEAFVLFPERVAPGLYEQVHSLCRQAGFAPRVVQEALEWLTIMALVDAGLGVSIVPASFGKLRWGGVTYRPLRPASTRTVVDLAFDGDSVRPATERFVEMARDRARGSER